MRVSFMGKGGSGKTTLTAAFVKYCQQTYGKVLTIDGDVNVHLSQNLQMSGLPISSKEKEIYKYFEGYRNTPIIGTTPPTYDSKFVRITPQDKFLKKYTTQKDGISLLTAGTYETSDIGYSCYHGKLGVIQMFFHHLLDTPDDMVVADFTAGIDSLGTSLFMVSDINIFVVEPTQKSIQVYKDFISRSENLDLKTFVVVNKVMDKDDEKFINSVFSENEVLGMVSNSNLLHKFDRGDLNSFDKFVSDNHKVFENIIKVTKANPRNWTKYYKDLVKVYNSNCLEWYNGYYGQKLDFQTIPDFSYEQIIKQAT